MQGQIFRCRTLIRHTILMNKILIALPFKEYLTYHPVSLRLRFSLVEQQSLREQCSGVKQRRFTPRWLFKNRMHRRRLLWGASCVKHSKMLSETISTLLLPVLRQNAESSQPSGHALVTPPETNPGILNSSPILSNCETLLLKILYQLITSGIQVYIKSTVVVFCLMEFGVFFRNRRLFNNTAIRMKGKKTEQEKLVNQVCKDVRT